MRCVRQSQEGFRIDNAPHSLVKYLGSRPFVLSIFNLPFIPTLVSKYKYPSLVILPKAYVHNAQYSTKFVSSLQSSSCGGAGDHAIVLG